MTTTEQLEETGRKFIDRVGRLRGQIRATEAEIAKVERTTYADVALDRSYETEWEATLAMADAQAAHREPELAKLREQLNTLQERHTALNQARTKEVQCIRRDAALGRPMPQVVLPDWRQAPELVELTKALDASAADLAKVEGALVERIQAAEDAKQRAKELAAAARLGRVRPRVWDTAREAASQAEAQLAEARERVAAAEDLNNQLTTEHEQLEGRLRDEWIREREAEVKAAAAEVVESLRAAAEKYVTYKARCLALYPDGRSADQPWLLQALDFSDEYAEGRRWIEALQRAGWVA